MAEQAQKPAKYQRRRPELTPCFKIVNEHLDSFVQARKAENRPLPQYVIDEFEAFIKCGIPALMDRDSIGVQVTTANGYAMEL